jgi:hypothetical protein
MKTGAAVFHTDWLAGHQKTGSLSKTNLREVPTLLYFTY